MIVFVAGMQRSGSTFSFNVVRELLAKRCSLYQEACQSVFSAIEKSGHAQHVLFKSHNADDFTIRMIELGVVKVVCTVRKPEDAIASWMDIFGFPLEESVAHMLEWIKMFERLRGHALIVPYEEIDCHPQQAAEAIARYVCPDAQTNDIENIVSRYTKENLKSVTDSLSPDRKGIVSLPFSYYDTKTFFHRRHISTITSRPAADRIGDSAVQYIRGVLRDYIDEGGSLLV